MYFVCQEDEIDISRDYPPINPNSNQVNNAKRLKYLF